MGKGLGPEGLVGIVLAGIAVVPTTAMVMAGHTWMAAGTIAAVLVAAVAMIRTRARAAHDRDREILSFATAATSLGTDPAPIIKALRGADGGEDSPYVVVTEERPEARPHIPRGRW